MAEKKISRTEAIREILSCAKNPVYFIEKYCKVQHEKRGLVPFDLYPYQKEAVKAFLKNDKVIVNKARQLGFSTLTAAFICWLILFHNDKKVLVISTKAEVAKNMIVKVKIMLSKLPKWMFLTEIETNRAHMIGLANRSWVKSIATSDDAGRSEALSLLVLDEAAHIPNMEELWKSASSTLATGGRVIALSCVTKDTVVFTDNGPCEIGNFIKKDTRGSYEIEQYSVLGKDTLRKGHLFHNNGKVKTKKINTKFSNLEGSFNHKLWAYKKDYNQFGWFKLEELTTNDWISLQYGMNIWGNNDDVSSFVPSTSVNIKNIFNPKKIDNNLAYFLGLFLAEGSSCIIRGKNGGISGGNVTITCGDNVKPQMETLGLHVSSHDNLHYTISSKNLIEFMQYLGFDLSLHAKHKVIPQRLLEMSKSNICSMLSGFFDGDGCSRKTRDNVSTLSSSKKLICQIRMLLLNLGILTDYSETITKPTKKVKVESLAHKIELSQGFSKIFYDTVGFGFLRKQNNKKFLDVINLKKANGHDVVPGIKDLFKEAKKELKVKKIKLGNWTLEKKYNLNLTSMFTKHDMSRQNCLKFYSIIKDYLSKEKIEIFDKILNKNLMWIPIKSIEESENETYDFSLPDNENDFWAHSVVYNGILGHQTPKGINNWFHEYYTKAESGQNDWLAFLTHWYEHPEYAVGLKDDENYPGGKTSPWFERMTSGWSRQQIAQELLTSFVDTASTYFDIEAIQAAEREAKTPLEKTGPDKNLWIWDNARSGKKYLIAADSASGAGEDYSTFCVLDLWNVEIVAEYMGKMQPDLFGDLLVETAIMYNNAYICPENNTYGFATAQQIRQKGYSNLCYFNKDGKLVDRWYGQWNNIIPGFGTDVKTRPMILAKLEEYFRKKQIKTFSKRFVSELYTFGIINGKPQAQKGQHDDLIMAYAIAVWVRDTVPDFGAPNHINSEASRNIIYVNRKELNFNPMDAKRAMLEFQKAQEKQRIKEKIDRQKMILPHPINNWYRK